jgi:DNA-binding CsgD family transcriptional regulator
VSPARWPLAPPPEAPLEVGGVPDEPARAAALRAESLALFHDLGEPQGAAAALYGLAGNACVRGDHTRAVRLFAAAEALGAAAGAPGGAFLRAAPRLEYARRLAAARTALGESAFAVAWAEGRALPPDRLVALALESVPRAPRTPPPANGAGGNGQAAGHPRRPAGAARPDGLTAREEDVLRLVAAGKRNKEIAGDLVLSVRTVEKHVANLYAKIGARGRADAAAYALRHGLLPQEAPPT